MWLEPGHYGGAAGGGAAARGLVGGAATAGHWSDETLVTAPGPAASTASTLVQVLRGGVGELASPDHPLRGDAPGAPGVPHLHTSLQGSTPASSTEGGEAAARPGVFKS